MRAAPHRGRHGLNSLPRGGTHPRDCGPTRTRSRSRLPRGRARPLLRCSAPWRPRGGRARAVGRARRVGRDLPPPQCRTGPAPRRRQCMRVSGVSQRCAGRPNTVRACTRLRMRVGGVSAPGGCRPARTRALLRRGARRRRRRRRRSAQRAGSGAAGSGGGRMRWAGLGRPPAEGGWGTSRSRGRACSVRRGGHAGVSGRARREGGGGGYAEQAGRHSPHPSSSSQSVAPAEATARRGSQESSARPTAASFQEMGSAAEGRRSGATPSSPQRLAPCRGGPREAGRRQLAAAGRRTRTWMPSAKQSMACPRPAESSSSGEWGHCSGPPRPCDGACAAPRSRRPGMMAGSWTGAERGPSTRKTRLRGGGDG